MYRKAGSQSALSGVLSGPYTGGARRVDAGRLAETTRARIARALGGHGEPSPIAYERSASLVAPIGASWGIVASIAVVTYVFAIGFGDPDSPWARQPTSTVMIYLAAGALFAFPLFGALRRRALLGKGALRPGRYLFPLDVVEIALPDRTGRQSILVRPLGDARDARIERSGRKTELVILFEDSSNARFPLRGDPSGDVALKRLEQAQLLLEELSYASGLEAAFTHDLFFDLRVDRSWDRVAPGEAAEDKTSAARAAILGRHAPLLALGLAVAIGGGAFFARRGLGDHALAVRAERIRVSAELARVIGEEAARDAARDAAREAAFRNMGPSARRVDAAACLEGLRAKQSSAHPETMRILEHVVHDADASNERIVPIRFVRVGPTTTTPELEADFAKKEKIIAATFARNFDEVCPAQILQLTGDAPSGRYATTLEIRYTVSSSATATVVRDYDGTPFDVHPVRIDFEVRFRATSITKDAAFSLHMPPPAELTAQTRPLSLFPLPSSFHAAEYGNRVYSAMNARAFDRLYDELWSLFFAGDPKVPVKSP